METKRIPSREFNSKKHKLALDTTLVWVLGKYSKDRKRDRQTESEREREREGRG